MRRLVLPLAGATALLAACGSTGVSDGPPPTTAPPTIAASATASPSATMPPSASPTPSASATPSPAPSPSGPQSPLTGLPMDQPSPVLVVKLDNTRNAQPHAGLHRADVVYLEEVEYGITRIAAVFSSHVPERIGPVRSARITDIDLLAQYGRPAFAFSGAQRKLFPVLDAAPFYDISPRTGAEGYTRDYGRRAPYNYFLDGRVGLSRAPDASGAQDIGFAFDEQVPDGGRLANRAEMEWSYASAGFRYDPQSGRYDVELNGLPARAEGRDRGQQASTVVIQYVRQTPSIYFDRYGGNTPHAETIGSGRAVVLRDGIAWRVRWERPDAESGTTFRTADGAILPFKPGQTWVVLLDRERTANLEPMTARPEPTPSLTASSTAEPSTMASPAATGSPGSS